MNIYNLLSDSNTRITIGDRWLIFDTNGDWIVYECKKYQKRTRLVLQTQNEDAAIKELLKES